MTPSVFPEHQHNFFLAGNPVLSDDQKKIIEILSKSVIMHSVLESAKSRIQQIVGENEFLSEQRHIIVVGDSGCGKTTLLDTIADELPPKEDVFVLGYRKNQLVLMVSLPGTITPREMARRLLRALGDTSALNGTCAVLTERLIKLMKDCNVKAVFMDELQHLLGLGRGNEGGVCKRLLTARNWLKSLVVATRATFVLMGMPETLSLIDSDEQLERRFTHVMALEPFGGPESTGSGLTTFIDNLLMTAVQDLGLFDSAEWFSYRLDDPKLKDKQRNLARLYLATGGSPSVTKDLVIRAALNAHARGSRQITFDDFQAAYASHRMAKQELKAALRRREKRQTLVAALEGSLLNPFAANDAQINEFSLKMVG